MYHYFEHHISIFSLNIISAKNLIKNIFPVFIALNVTLYDFILIYLLVSGNHIMYLKTNLSLNKDQPKNDLYSF